MELPHLRLCVLPVKAVCLFLQDLKFCFCLSPECKLLGSSNMPCPMFGVGKAPALGLGTGSLKPPMVLLLQPSWACEMRGNYWIRDCAEACPPALGLCWPLGSELPLWNVLRVAVPLAFSDSTVLRLLSGASSRAKQSGWMLMPMRDTMHGCCRACNMLASCRKSEKFFMASMALRCLNMVSAGQSKAVSYLGRISAAEHGVPCGT